MTHYQVLDIPPTAAAAEVKAAWHKARTTLHPDRPNGDAAAFRAAAEAYEVLADGASRAQYDRQIAAPAGDEALEAVMREAAPQVARSFATMRKAAQGRRYVDLAVSTLGLVGVFLNSAAEVKRKRKPRP